MSPAPHSHASCERVSGTLRPLSGTCAPVAARIPAEVGCPDDLARKGLPVARVERSSAPHSAPPPDEASSQVPCSSPDAPAAPTAQPGAGGATGARPAPACAHAPLRLRTSARRSCAPYLVPPARPAATSALTHARPAAPAALDALASDAPPAPPLPSPDGKRQAAASASCDCEEEEAGETLGSLLHFIMGVHTGWHDEVRRELAHVPAATGKMCARLGLPRCGECARSGGEPPLQDAP